MEGAATGGPCGALINRVAGTSVDHPHRLLPPLAISVEILTPLTKDVKDDEDEAIDDPPVVEDHTARRSLSPAAKRQWELEQKMSEDDLHQMREAQWATVGAQARMPVLVKVLPFRLVRYSCGTEVHSFVGSCIVLTWIYVGQMSNLRARWAHRIHLQGRGHQTMRPGLGLLLTTW
jgi:hypothetical protein